MITEWKPEEIKSKILQRNKKDQLIIHEGLIHDVDLSNQNLQNIDFQLSRFERVDLKGADFSKSNIQGVLFLDCPMQNCKFIQTNMKEAVFRGIDLMNANLSGANLFSAILENANLQNVHTDENTKWFKMQPPEKGAFIGWKCCTEWRVVQLLIPADARRVSATLPTCRCDKAKVLSIKNIDETVEYEWAQSTVDPDFYYERGKWIEPANGFEPDRWKDSSPGIHFFMERQQAVDYQTK